MTSLWKQESLEGTFLYLPEYKKSVPGRKNSAKDGMNSAVPPCFTMSCSLQDTIISPAC